jgi:DNA-binding CsgD family transcriptional regulator
MDQSLAASEPSITLASRLGLHVVEGMLLQLAAHVHAVRLDDAAMDAALSAAAAAAQSATIRALGEAFVRSTLRLLRGDIPGARVHLEAGMAELRRDPVAPPAHCWGLWALVRAAADDGADEAIDALVAAGAAINFANRAHVALANALASGRAGDPGGAGEFEHGLEQLPPLWRHVAALIAAPAAAEFAPGVATGALRDAEAFFSSNGYGDAASAVRQYLRAAGARVPRGGRSARAVPPSLLALGVTAREAEVLGLIADGLTNAEIAARLFLSPRTVEKHVERLVQKTQVAGRGQLIAYANRV